MKRNAMSLKAILISSKLKENSSMKYDVRIADF